MQATTRVGADRSRLPSLTGLRFIAAFMVLLCHMGISLLPRTGVPELAGLSKFAYAAGSVGVSFFFVLSGFVLTWVARPDDTKVLFWRRRLVKIFPNHLVAAGAAIVLMLTAGIAVTTANTVPSLFLVQTWIPAQEVVLNYGANVPNWSLSCELAFYLCFPLLLLLVRRIRPERLWLWAGVVVLAIAAVPFAAKLLPDQPQMLLTGDAWLQVWFVYYFPLSRMLEFVLGIVVAQIVLHGRWIRIPITASIALALAAYVVGGALPVPYGYVAPTALPLALVIGAVATADIVGRRTWFGGPVMVWLGEISYALYIVHFLVVSYGPIGAVDPANWAKLITLPEALRDIGLTIAICLVLAWLLYALVERPAMRRWSRPAKAHRPESTVERAPSPELV